MIIGIDPGKTTGVACVNANTLYCWYDDELIQEDLIEFMRVRAQEAKPDHVFVIEEWRNHSRWGDRCWAAEGIGIVKALMPWGIDELVIQTPSQAKQAWPDKRLRKHGYGITGHARDALRHALYYIEKTYGDINEAEPF